MGKGTIASGGTDGLYQVTLDYGQAARDARVAKINSDLAALVSKIAAAQSSLDAQQEIEDAQKVVVDGAIDAYITVSNTPEAPASALENTLKNYTDAAAELARMKGDTAALRIPLNMLKSEQAQLKKDQSTWTALVLTETVSAWCADLTDDATGEVATIEIPGENALVLVAPAAPAPGPADGLLTAREVQSPEQVFWNAAVLPGWQKWKPTYRLGTITALDVEADTSSVTLDAAYSSAQGLNVNQATSLTAVPVVYMSCNALAFEVGDRCVVAFTGQSQDAPKVVGFLDHPKSCFPKFLSARVSAKNFEDVVEVIPAEQYTWNAKAVLTSVNAETDWGGSGLTVSYNEVIKTYASSGGGTAENEDSWMFLIGPDSFTVPDGTVFTVASGFIMELKRTGTHGVGTTFSIGEFMAASSAPKIKATLGSKEKTYVYDETGPVYKNFVRYKPEPSPAP